MSDDTRSPQPGPEQAQATGADGTPEAPEGRPGDGAASAGGAAPSPAGTAAGTAATPAGTTATTIVAEPGRPPGADRPLWADLSEAGSGPPSPLFGRRWRGPADPPTRAVLIGAVAAGLTAAVAIPPGRPGVGWFVTAFVVAGALVAVGRRTPRSGRALLVDGAWLLMAVALAAVSAIRDADWFVMLCLLAACGAGSLAVAGRYFGNVIVAGLVVPAAAFRAVPWLGRRLRQGNLRKVLRLLVASLVSVVLLGIFAPLLADADAAFAAVLDGLIPTVDGPSFRWFVLFGLGFGCVIGAGFVLAAPPPPQVPDGAPARLRGLEWALPIGLLAGLFALFVGVQFATLFASDEYVVSTTGVTYAEYARSGFWQLLAVTALALVVIVAGVRWAPQGTPAERATKRTLLATLAGLTLVIVASALNRMWLYQQAYGFTVLRLLVLTCELWLGAGFLIALWAVLRLRAGGPLRGMVVTGAVALLALAVLSPERFVAERNVDRFERTGRIDIFYLGRLSADVVPTLARLPEPARSCALEQIARRLAWDRRDPDATDWRSANASRPEAERVLADLRPVCQVQIDYQSDWPS